MKQITLFLASILVTVTVFSQDFFIKAGFGAGSSSSSFKMISADAYRNSNTILSEQGQLNIGFVHHNLQVETGIGYLRTGVSFMHAYGEPTCGGGPVLETTTVPVTTPLAKYTIRNSHLLMPLIISHAINKQKRISFYPGIGFEAAYNFKGIMTTSGEAQDDIKVNYQYNPMSVILLLKFDAQCRINKQWSVWASPSYQNMLTSLTKKVSGDYMSRTYDHALLFNVGVRYNFSCPFHCPFHCASKTTTTN